MLERLSRSRRNAALAVLGVLVLWFSWSIRSVLNPLLLGYLLAYVMHPIVERVRGRRLSRLSHRGAVNLTFALGGALFLIVGLGLVQQTRGFVRDVIANEEMSERLRDRWLGLRERLVEVLPEDFIPDGGDMDDVFASVRELLQRETTREAAAEAAEMGLRATGGLLHGVGNLMGWLFGVGGLLVLVPLYTYFMLFELDRLHAFVRRYLPKRERARLTRVYGQIGEVLASFFRGRLLICLFKGALLAIGLQLVGVPYAFLFGMGSGFLALIPAFGPIVGFAGSFLVTCLEPEATLSGALLRTGIVFGLAEIIEGYVLIPRVLGDSLGLHPMVVLFSVFAGGAALGLFGVLVALPLTASIVILVREFVLPALARFADEEQLA